MATARLTESSMPTTDPRVDAYIAGAPEFARPILERARAVVHEACPHVEETLKWGMPTFMYRDKIVCGIAGFKAHCALWFRQGKAIVGKSARGDGMGHFGRITLAKDAPSAARLKAYVNKAMRLIDAQHARKARSKR